jgi:hypothetical protein
VNGGFFFFLREIRELPSEAVAFYNKEIAGRLLRTNPGFQVGGGSRRLDSVLFDGGDAVV